jgi:hypothetical protein
LASDYLKTGFHLSEHVSAVGNIDDRSSWPMKLSEIKWLQQTLSYCNYAEKTKTKTKHPNKTMMDLFLQ